MFCLVFLGEVNPPVGDGERITVRLVGGFAGRKLNDPRSAFGHASEPVDGLAFATHTPVVAAKADLVQALSIAIYAYTFCSGRIVSRGRGVDKDLAGKRPHA